MVLRGSLYSNVLSMETGLTVITPNDYGQTAGSYRVCYVLHGLCGGNGDYGNYTQLPLYAYDRDVIFLCPEVARGFYTDTQYGVAYFRYVSEELPHQAALQFHISDKREDTAVVGGSMGGYGALKCALKFPERYGFCGALAPAALELADYFAALASGATPEIPDFSGIFGCPPVCGPDDDLPTLARRAAGGRCKPQMYLCCGDQDPFLPAVKNFSELLASLGFAPDFEHWEAHHDLFFFNDAVRRAVTRFAGPGCMEQK